MTQPTINSLHVEKLISKGFLFLLDLLNLQVKDDKVIDNRKIKFDEAIFMGARKSAKTKSVALVLVLATMFIPGMSVLMLRKIREICLRSVVSEILWAIRVLGVSEYFIKNEKKRFLQYTGNNNKIYWDGMKSNNASQNVIRDGKATGEKKKQVKLAGLSDSNADKWFVWIEEAYEFDDSDIEDLDEAIRGNWYVKIFTLNPWTRTQSIVRTALKVLKFDLAKMKKVGTMSALKSDNFITMFVHYSNFLINDKISQIDLKKILQTIKKNPTRAKTSVWGQPGVDGNLSHPNFKREEHVISKEAFCKNLLKHVVKWNFQLDFGLSHATTISLSAVLSDNRTRVVVDEFFHSNEFETDEESKKTIFDYQESVFRFIEQMSKEWNINGYRTVISDYGGGGRGFIQELNRLKLMRRGFHFVNFIEVPTKEDRESRLVKMNSKIESDEYFVVESCADHIRELETSIIDGNLLNNKQKLVRLKKTDDTLDREDYGMIAEGPYYLRMKGKNLENEKRQAVSDTWSRAHKSE